MSREPLDAPGDASRSRAREWLSRVRAAPVVDWPIRLAVGMRDHNALSAASAMAFNFFLSFIPVLAVLGYLLGHVVKRKGVAAMLEPVGDAVPFARTIGESELLRLADASVSIAPLSVAGFLWVTSSGAANVIDTFELALGTRRRPWFVQRAIALAWVGGMLSAVCALLAFAVDVDVYLDDERLPIGRRVAALVGSWEPRGVLVALALLFVAGLAVLYRYGVIHADERRRVTWPGAALAVAVGALITWGFGVYVRSVARYAVFYGSLAAVATIMIWLYLISLAVLFGAEVNAQLETHRGARER